MSFSANLYNCKDDRRKLSKTLTGQGIPVNSITPTGAVSLSSPTFILSYDESYIGCNYLVIDEAPFNRCYFIEDMQIDIGKKIVISCVVDVLQTYKKQIKKLTANVVRQEGTIKEMLPDNSFCYLNQIDVINKLMTVQNYFGNQIDGGHYTVLAIAGADNSHFDDVDGFTKLTSAPADWAMRYIFYWVNAGSSATPNMVSIGQLVTEGTLPQNVSYADVEGAYGGVYEKDRI